MLQGMYPTFLAIPTTRFVPRFSCQLYLLQGTYPDIPPTGYVHEKGMPLQDMSYNDVGNQQ